MFVLIKKIVLKILMGLPGSDWIKRVGGKRMGIFNCWRRGNGRRKGRRWRRKYAKLRRKEDTMLDWRRRRNRRMNDQI